VDEERLTVAIKNIARTCGDEISEEEPILDARLEDGSRCGGDVSALQRWWCDAHGSAIFAPLSA
jgi:Flp pilus assembly CpaF family ATPase